MPEQILHLTYFGGVLTQIAPMTVVQRDALGQMLWIGVGTPVQRPRLEGKLRDIPRDEWPPGGFPLDADTWYGFDALIWQPTGANHSVWWFFQPGGEFQNWYVNLETRSADGAQIVDQELDIWVHPDRSWEWKDEESFAAKTGDPRFWGVEEAAEIRAEGERVAKLIDAGEFP
ncbi:MAG: DUF402 domain-containing protein, partial [Micromonosporaceae bacterium]